MNLKYIIVPFLALAILNTIANAQQQSPCDANPFCSDTSYNFPNLSGAGSAISGPSYGCLGSEPNAIWYYMQIGTSGPMQLSIYQTSTSGNGIDVDFAMWGPFTSLEDGCAEVMDGTAPLQCSYSASASETIGLGMPGGYAGGASTPPEAQVGEVYIVVLTNFNGSPGSISFQQTAGTGSADCGIVCGLSASNTGPVCLGNSANLIALTTDTETVFNYIWSGPDGFSATTQNATVTPSAPGTYTYTVMGIAVNGSGGNDTCTATTDVVVNPLPNVSLVNSQSQTLCNDPVYTLALSTPSDFATYQWYRNDSAIAGATNTSYAATESGTYYVIGNSDAGCSRTSSPVTLYFNTFNVDFDFSLSKGCKGDTVQFNNLSDSPAVYSWNFSDGSGLDSTVSPLHFYDTQGAYNVMLKGVDTLGCRDSVSKVVDTRHPLNAVFGQSADSVCQTGDASVLFTNQSVGDIDEWHWNFGDGATSDLESPTHIYTVAGTYTVQLVVKETGLPCTDTAYSTIYVDSTQDVKIISDRDSICNGEKINFSLDYLHSATNFHWNFGDNAGIEGYDYSNTAHSYDNPGTYQVTITLDYPVCPSVTDNDTITVKPYPVINLPADTSLCLNGAPFIIVNNGGVDPAIRWRWSTGDTTAVLKIVHPGTYTVLANLDGCVTNDQLTVRKDCYVDVPNAFTPNGDGANDYFFPRQYLTEGVTDFKMTVFDRWGQKVFETTQTDGRGWDGKFNDKEQPSGVYVYIIDIRYKNKAAEHYEGNVTLIR